MSGVNDEQEQEPRTGGGRPLREMRGDSVTPLGRSHQGGGETVVVESHDDFPGVEISIAGGVGEMVRANYCHCFSFFFSFSFF